MYTHSTSFIQDGALSEPSYFAHKGTVRVGLAFPVGKCNRKHGSMGGNAREPRQQESRME